MVVDEGLSNGSRRFSINLISKLAFALSPGDDIKGWRCNSPASRFLVIW